MNAYPDRRIKASIIRSKSKKERVI